MNDVADLRLLASLDRACDCGVDGPIYAPLHEGPCQHDAARQKIANLGGWKGISIQQAAEITRLRAELAEAKESAKPAHAVGFAAGIEAAAIKATSFLVGDPKNGVPLRNPMAHEIAEAIRALTPPDSVTPGFAVALPDMDACKQAVSDQFNALDAYYPAMEARCVETAVLWESPIPRRKP